MCVHVRDRNLSSFLILHDLIIHYRASFMRWPHSPASSVKWHFGTLFMSFKYRMRKLLWNFNGKFSFVFTTTRTFPLHVSRFFHAEYFTTSNFLSISISPKTDSFLEDLNFCKNVHVVSLLFTLFMAFFSLGQTSKSFSSFKTYRHSKTTFQLQKKKKLEKFWSGLNLLETNLFLKIH